VDATKFRVATDTAVEAGDSEVQVAVATAEPEAIESDEDPVGDDSEVAAAEA